MQEHALIETEFSLFYRIAGKGEPVVLIHGFGEDSTIWDGIIGELSKEYKLIVPDLAGSGRSTGNMNELTIDSMADQIKQILKKENINSCWMIGHSMGGYITLAFAEKFPGELKGLGLFHSTVYADSEEKKGVRIKNIEFIKKYGAAKFLEQAIPNLFSVNTKQNHPEIIKEVITRYSNFSPTALVAYTQAMKDRPDRSAVLENFPNRVMLIIGEFDNIIPIEESMKMCKIADFAYIYIGARSGHMGMLEESDFCLNGIRDFLSGN